MNIGIGELEMTAEEMFERLGYEVTKNDKEIIEFEYRDDWSKITFDKIRKVYWADCLGRAECIYLSLHKAINQMVGELA